MRYYSNTAVETELSTGINNSVQTIPVLSVSGFPVSFPYTLVIDEGEVTEELIEVTAAAGLNLTASRGVDNTSAATHSAGATVKHVTSARDYREAQEHIDATSGVHGVTGALVGTTDTQTLTNKTIDLTDNTLSGTLAELNAAITDTDVVGIAATQTLTGKTLSLASNTLQATLAQLNAAVSDADLVSLAGTETLTSKTLTSPVLNSADINSPDIDGGTLDGATIGSNTLNGTLSGSGSISVSGVIGLADGAGREITLGYGGSGGLAIAQGSATPHPNGVVLFVSGTTLYAMKPGGGTVAIA